MSDFAAESADFRVFALKWLFAGNINLLITNFLVYFNSILKY